MEQVKRRPVFSFETNYDKLVWLIYLRFILISLVSVILSTVLFFGLDIGLSSEMRILLIWNLSAVVINVLFLVDLNYIREKRHIIIDHNLFRYIGFIHIDFDIIYVLSLIYMTGGFDSPLLFLFIYNVITTAFIIEGRIFYYYSSLTLIIIVLSGVHISFLQQSPYISASFRAEPMNLVFTVILYVFTTYISKYISMKLYSKQNELNDLYEKTYMLSITDRLTGLYDQTYFRRASADALEIAKFNNNPLAFVLFDIDNFKEFNDTNGHLLGSSALKQIAVIMRRSFRKTDILGKYGGDEFIILMKDTEIDYIPAVLKRFQRNISEHDFNPDTGQVSRLTISIGVAVFPDDGVKCEDLIDKADKALYGAKKSGKDRLVLFGDFKH